MLKSFSEKIFQQVVDIKPGRAILSAEQRDNLLYTAKRVRAKDYYIEVDIPENTVVGQVFTRAFTTTANWYFIMTGCASIGGVMNAGLSGTELGIKFQNFYPTSPFGSEPENMNNVPFELVFGREGLGRFEEYKNLYYSLGQRFTVNVDVRNRQSSNDPYRVGVIITGLEFNLQDEGVE